MAVLQNDNEQLEQEKSALKERLKQLTKIKLVEDITNKSGISQRMSGILSKKKNNVRLFSFHYQISV